MYLYETHFHTQEVSPCGQVSAERGVLLYAQAGYSGILVTDHFNAGVCEMRGFTSKTDCLEYFLSGYRAAKAAAMQLKGKYPLKILLGAEFRYKDIFNEFLLIGITEEFLYKHKLLWEYTPEELRRLLDENNILAVQAHPFREGMSREPDFYHGIEVYNNNPRHDSNNKKALEYALDENIGLVLSGSDFHMEEDTARGGVYLPTAVDSSAEMAATLLAGGTMLKFI